MSEYKGDFVAGSVIEHFFTTNAAAGGAVAPSSAFENADVIVYKNHSATQRSSVAGITMTSPFDSITGLHQLSIDTSDNTDGGFFAAGNDYAAVLSPDTETVDGQTVVKVLFTFSIENRNTKANVTAIAANVITAAAIAADAIGASELAADAVTEIVAGVFARAFSAAYGSYTFDQLVSMFAAALLSKCSGMGTATATFRNPADSGNVIVASVDASGNRTAVTLTP